MSDWHEVKEEDIDIDKDMVNIHVGTNYQGAIYIEIPLAVLKKKLEMLERLDEEKVEKTIIAQCVYCKFWDGKGHKLAQAICNKFGVVKKEG